MSQSDRKRLNESVVEIPDRALDRVPESGARRMTEIEDMPDRPRQGVEEVGQAILEERRRAQKESNPAKCLTDGGTHQRIGADEILQELETAGSDSYRNILYNHGVRDPVFGAKVSDMKKIQKVVKKDYELALKLYATRIYDAQYLAGLIADEKRMTPTDLREWARTCNCSAIAASAVAWVAAESNHGREMALEWIDSADEVTCGAGWSTYGGLVALRPDALLDQGELATLVNRIEKTIHEAPNRVRYSMNSFLIALGIHVAPCLDLAVQAGERIGPVSVDMGKTACRVPYAPDYIRKAQARGSTGKKRKTVRC